MIEKAVKKWIKGKVGKSEKLLSDGENGKEMSKGNRWGKEQD